ncbi:MAG: hypothetical protein ACKOKF_02870 [Bacteroidota bacterium]
MIQLFCQQVHAADFQFRKDDRISRAHGLIYELRFSEARRLLSQVRSDHPTDLSAELEEMTILFLEAFITEDLQRFSDFEKKADRFLDDVADAQAAPEKGMASAAVYLQWSVLEARNDEYLEAAWHLRQSNVAATDNQIEYPGFVPDDAVYGVLQCILGAVPPEYEWLLSVIGMQGSLQKGKSILQGFLKQTEKSDYTMYHSEALFFLSHLQTTLYADTEPDPYLMSCLGRDALSNDLLLQAYTGILLRNEGNDEVVRLLQSHTVKAGVFPLPGLKYRLGMARLRKFDRACIADFRSYIRLSNGKSLCKSSYQKIAWMRLIENDMTGYKTAMSDCIRYGESKVDEDKAALQEAEKGPVPDRDLLKARLAFDAGYYAVALQTAKATDPALLSSVSGLERTYRIARIHQAMGQDDLAIAGFMKAVKSVDKSGSHYPANSAFQLGIIFEKRRQPDSARTYYKLCLSMPDHAYKNSIDQKAKAALVRVGE